MVRTIAKIDRAHFLKAAQKRTGYGEQHQSDGNLRNYEDGAQPRMT